MMSEHHDEMNDQMNYHYSDERPDENVTRIRDDDE